MTKDQELARVKVVYMEKQTVPRPSGKVYRYFRWMGYYREDGKRIRVYVGPDLPEWLKHLAKPGKYITQEAFDNL